MNFLKLSSILALTFFIGCGGGGSEEQKTDQATSTSQRTIEIVGTNSLKFAVEAEAEGLTVGEADAQETELLLLESITAKPGETLTIRLTTRSTMPPAAMSHNWVLLEQGTDTDAFANAAIQAKDNDYIPANQQESVIAHTELAAGGETVEVTFTVPEQTGEYDYICSFPGHYVGGMRGTLVVEG